MTTEATDAPQVFARKETGLRREASARDVFIYNTNNQNIGIGVAFVVLLVPPLYAGASMVTATILAGLLALLHATPSRELRSLTVADIDATARTIRLGHRPHPVPLDPASWHALQCCLDHRERLGTRNPHVIVTTHTKTRRTPASDQYLVRVLDPAGTGSRTLRATRLVDLVSRLDPKLVCEALGMDPAGILPYAADQVQDIRLADL